jgi:Ca2+-binding RTX toxin-like protein
LGAGSDTLFGGGGNDRLDTGAGAAVVNGGTGNDLWLADFSADATAKTINLNLSGSHAAGGGTTYAGIEAISILGGAGNDVFITRVGDLAHVFGDTINAGDGNDTVKLGGGADSVDGGAGNDLLIIDVSTAAAGTNFSTLGGNVGITDFSTSDMRYTGFERLDVRTGAGLDRIVLGAGNDTFAGGAGNDTVTGGGGADRLTGDDGGDTFVFLATTDSTVALAGRDTITDFDASADVIDLHQIDAIAGGGFYHFTFIDGAAFTALGQVRVMTSGGNTIIQANTTGGLGADMAITLTGSHVLDISNFAL